MENIWYKDFSNIFTKDNFYLFFPSKYMSLAEKLNSLLRFFVYWTILAYLLAPRLFKSLVITLIIYIVVSYAIYEQDTGENTKRLESNEEEGMMNVEGKMCRTPSRHNPFMNLPVSEFNKPHRADMPNCDMDEPGVQDNIDNQFNQDLYTNIEDVWDKKASQRQFYTVPSQTHPNSQQDFAHWLYNDCGHLKDKWKGLRTMTGKRVVDGCHIIKPKLY
jgi:hypothetical protein